MQIVVDRVKYSLCFKRYVIPDNPNVIPTSYFQHYLEYFITHTK